MDLAYNFNGRTYTGYLARKVRSSLAPGVLVIHGGGGLGPHARRRADMLAERGYVAFACDLFGETVAGLEHAHTLVSAFTEDWGELRRRFTDPFAEASGVPGLKYDYRADRRAWAAMHALFAETLGVPVTASPSLTTP